MSEDDQEPRGCLEAALLVAVGAAFFHFNGWQFHAEQFLRDTTGAGLSFDEYRGAYGFFIRINGTWYGVARTNLAAQLVDAPIINLACLVTAAGLVGLGLQALFKPKRAASGRLAEHPDAR